MTTRSLKKFTELLNRSEGLSIIPIIVVMVIMSVMGGVFSSIMGEWKISAPITINSNKASYLAETAAMFALQDAKNRFFSKDVNGVPNFPSLTTGTRSNPYVVSSSGTETAYFWIERPYLSGTSPYSTNSTVDLDRGNNDDIITGANDDEDDVDDDDDDATVNPTTDVNNDGFSDVYTIIATGEVLIDGTTTTIAKRQIKVLADIIIDSAAEVAPGVQTEGVILGTGGSLEMQNDDGTITTSFGVGIDNNTGPDGEDGIVIRPPDVDLIDEDFIKALAIDQGHYNAVDLVVDNSNDDYPEPTATPSPSFYYDTPTDTIPNFTYVGQDLTIGSNRKAHGVIWVKRNVILNGTATMNAIIICEGDITLNGTSDIVGGIVHYGSVINGNGNPNTITIDSGYFNALSVSIPIITVQSWQEAVSAN